MGRRCIALEYARRASRLWKKGGSSSKSSSVRVRGPTSKLFQQVNIILKNSRISKNEYKAKVKALFTQVDEL